MDELLHLDVLEEQDPFEIDAQAAHLFKHPHLGLGDVYDVWVNDPLFYPANGALSDGGRGGRHRSGRADRAIAIGRSEQVPADRLLRGFFGPCRYLPKGP